MKSATNDPPRKVAGEAGVGLRERPLAGDRTLGYETSTKQAKSRIKVVV